MHRFTLKRYNAEVYSEINLLRQSYVRETDFDYELPGVVGFEKAIPFPSYPVNPPMDHSHVLHMGGKLLEGLPAIPTDAVFEKSKALGFTKYGEMFSNEWMATLATTIWPNVSATVEPLPDAHELVKKVFNKKVILFAYDGGYASEPISAKGLQTNWAVVTGYLYVTFTQFWDLEATEEDVPFFDEERDSFHIFAHHGKSDNTAFFNWKAVLDSNAQLNEVRTDKDYIVPADGMHLKGTCVVLSKDD